MPNLREIQLSRSIIVRIDSGLQSVPAGTFVQYHKIVRDTGHTVWVLSMQIHGRLVEHMIVTTGESPDCFTN